MSTEIRCDANRLRPDRLESVLAWVRSLGIDPANVGPHFLITQGEREWELHLSERVRDDEGRLILDRAADAVVTKPLVIGLGTEKTWPDITGGTTDWTPRTELRVLIDRIKRRTDVGREIAEALQEYEKRGRS